MEVLEQFDIFIFKNRVDDTKNQLLRRFIHINLAVIKSRSVLQLFLAS